MDAALTPVTLPAQTRLQPLFLSVPTCSHRAPPKLTNTVSTCTVEALNCVTSLGQMLNQPTFLSVPTCSQRAPPILTNTPEPVMAPASVWPVTSQTDAPAAWGWAVVPLTPRATLFQLSFAPSFTAICSLSTRTVKPPTFPNFLGLGKLLKLATYMLG